MKQEDSNVCINEPPSPLQVTEPSSPSQRPRRHVNQKLVETNNGLLWREEKELKKALYASLNDTNKRTRSGEMGETDVNGSGIKQKSKSNGNCETNAKRTRVHAQRKFAQGSTPSSPIPTPLKMCSSSSITAVDVFPCRRPKTEDFLTFLCLRGTPILPPSLDFFSNWSRDDSCSEKSYYSEPDNYHDDLNNDGSKDDENNEKLDVKSSNDMSAFHRQASAKLTAVKQKLSSRHNDFHDTNANTSTCSYDSRKRKSSVDESTLSIKKSVANKKHTLPFASVDLNQKRKPHSKSSSLNALREKYKKQLIQKKNSCQLSPTLKVRQSATSESDQSENEDDPKSPKTNQNNKPKISSKSNAQKRDEIMKSLEKRKSLRSARKMNEMTETYLEVSSKNQSASRVRRARLVPPIVEVDSEDTEYDSEPLNIKSPITKVKGKDSEVIKCKKTEIVTPTLSVDDNDKERTLKTFSPAKKLRVDLPLLAIATNKQTALDHPYGKLPLSPTQVLDKISKITQVKPKVKIIKIEDNEKNVQVFKTESNTDDNVDETKRLTRSQKQKQSDEKTTKKPTNDYKSNKDKLKKHKKELNLKKPEQLLKQPELKNESSKGSLKLNKSNDTTSKSNVKQPKIGTETAVRSKEKIIVKEEEESDSDDCDLMQWKTKLLNEALSARNKNFKETKADKKSKIVEEILKSKKIGYKKDKAKKQNKIIEKSTLEPLKKYLDQEKKKKELEPDTSDSEKYFIKKKPEKKNKLKKKSKSKDSSPIKPKTTLDPLSLPLSAYLEQRMKFPSDSSSEDELPKILHDSESEVCISPPLLNNTKITHSVASTATTNEENVSSITSTSTSTVDAGTNASMEFIESMAVGVSSFETISNEMETATLPGELMFGSAEEIQGLMTSEFSGVFDENFPAGAILLTTRDNLPQVPLTFIQDISPSKSVADASTNTCEEDLMPCTTDDDSDISEPLPNFEAAYSTQTYSRTSPVITLKNLTTEQLLKTPEKASTSYVGKAKTYSLTPSPQNLTKLKPKMTTDSGIKPKITITSINNKRESFPNLNDTARLVEAPVYAPTAEEFQDPLEFILKIQPEAESYGICRIIPPASFKPECKVNDDMRFTAHNQYIHKMLYRWGPNSQHVTAIKRHLTTQGIKMDNAPLIGGIEMDLSRLYQTVQNLGGLRQVIEKKKWQRTADALHIPKAAQDRVNKLYDVYCKYLVSYETLPKDEKEKLEEEVIACREEKAQKKLAQNEKKSDDEDEDEEDDEDSNDCVTKGRSMSLSAFYRIARNTMSMWNRIEPTVDDVEKLYWKLVTDRLYHVVVHAGNIDSSVYGSGFPSNRSSLFSKHPWNLKVLTNNPGTVLRSMGPVSGVTIPTLHVGMLYTTGCWYRDPHTLPWIEYLHTGARKIWYGIPASASERFRKAMREIMPDVCTNNPIWLPSDTAMVPPSLLADHGASLCRTVQESGQFVVIFPSAFTSTICTGYVVSESVYFAPPNWLEMAQNSFQDIQNSSEPPAFSLERLLFAIANDGRTQRETLIKVLPIIRQIRDKELRSRKQLFESGLKTSERLPLMEIRDKRRKKIEEENEQECDICRRQCYISMVINTQEDSVFCLEHGYEMIQNKDPKTFKLMYTYDQSELNELINKVSDQLESIEKALLKKKSRRKLQISA